jgi:hypothetical protein
VQHPPLRRVLSVATVLTALVVATPASAQVVDGIPTSVVATPNAPLAITSCKVGRNIGPYGDPLNAVVVNRTTHAALSVGVQVRYYDQDGTLVGQGAPTRTLDAPLAGGDDVVLQFSSGADLSEPRTAIVRATCRLQSVVFTGRKKWAYGAAWTEKLVPLATEQASYGGGKGAAPRQVAVAPHVQVAVTKIWTDTLDGVLYVHDALAIVGSESTVTLRPSDLTLTVPLANGARKTYAGLQQAAPTYQRLNPFGSSTTTVPEVAPAEDFGRLGTMTIPPHGAVTTTVTFAITDPVARDATYREVSLR